jgi:hypothetical protein
VLQKVPNDLKARADDRKYGPAKRHANRAASRAHVIVG